MKATLRKNRDSLGWIVDGAELDDGKQYEIEITEKKPEAIGWDGVARHLFNKHRDQSMLTNNYSSMGVITVGAFIKALREARMIERKHICLDIIPMYRRHQVGCETYPADCVKDDKS